MLQTGERVNQASASHIDRQCRTVAAFGVTWDVLSSPCNLRPQLKSQRRLLSSAVSLAFLVMLGG